MNLFRNDRSFSLDEDVLIKKILLTHDPDGRHLDSELLIRAMENVICNTAELQVRNSHMDTIALNDTRNIEVFGAQESLQQIINRISCELLLESSSESDLHTRTMILFDLLGNYRWDDKVVLILAAFATSYGEFWLIMQLYPHNPLAVSVAMLKHLPNDLRMLKPMFKALRLLIKIMVDITKCIIKFEGRPFRHVTLDDEAMAIAKSYIYMSCYWVTRGTLTCSSRITDLITMKPEQVYSNSITIAAWKLSSLVYRLSSMCSRLSRHVDLCHQQIEAKLHQKLSNYFQEEHIDNQEVLDILLALKDYLPLKSSRQTKYHQCYQLGISELKDKVVLFLVSKPECLSPEGLLLLIHQTYDHPEHKKQKNSYEIVWVPVSFSDKWTDAEAEIFDFLSNSLPMYSIRQPWLLHSAIVSYLRQAWNFQDDPLMVVLDSHGMVTHYNAIDMVLIWGAKAFPFSSSREKDLWEEENWTIKFLVGDTDPVLTTWVEEGRNICIYASDNLDWIREFNTKFKNIRSAGVQLEMVYVGSRNLTELVRHILATINEEMHSSLLPFIKLHFFWLRLESMRRSKLRMRESDHSDPIQEQVLALLDSTDEGWAVIGRGRTSEILKLEGRNMMECLEKFQEWGNNVQEFGFLGALRNALEPPDPLLEPCNHTIILPYHADGIVLCEKCKRPMKKYIVYE